MHLPQPATVAQALQAAGLPWEGLACGIWGRVCDAATLVQAGDRVELYRPLTVDPKVARRTRFASQGARSTGLFAKRRLNSKAGY
ncbi:RnfH family protein [Comamonas sp. GB3 AK4-5]|uniref:RnfH family protein n=1 Tax=Comamonas sp. GB3 AK4-5 TaxID=3231487 RepID=UPI00351F1D2B